MNSGHIVISVKDESQCGELVIKYLIMLADLYYYANNRHLSTMTAVGEAIKVAIDGVSGKVTPCSVFCVTHKGDNSGVIVEFILDNIKVAEIDIPAY